MATYSGTAKIVTMMPQEDLYPCIASHVRALSNRYAAMLHKTRGKVEYGYVPYRLCIRRVSFDNIHQHKRSFSNSTFSHNKQHPFHSLPNNNKPSRSIITLEDLNQTVLFGKDSAIQSLAAFNARVNAQKVQTWIQPAQVEIFIKGVFEYAATSQREWFQHYAVDGGGWFGAISENNGTRLVQGTWMQETVGWGQSSQNNSSLIYYSLIPLLCFAVVSIFILGWSHWFDAPRETPYAPDIDPTDWLEAVIASSQGGLYNAFPKNVLESRKGLLEARKVRIRLGHVYEDGDETPKMGFVCVD